MSVRGAVACWDKLVKSNPCWALRECLLPELKQNSQHWKGVEQVDI